MSYTRTTGRTILQHHANELDLAIFRLIDRIEVHSREHRDRRAEFGDAAAALRRLRTAVRRDMHPKDVEDTSG